MRTVSCPALEHAYAGFASGHVPTESQNVLRESDNPAVLFCLQAVLHGILYTFFVESVII